MKYCSRCQTHKDEDQFHKGGGYCKPCRSSYNKEYKANNPEVYTQQRLRSVNNTRLLAIAKANPQVTIAEIEAFIAKDTGKCEICGGGQSSKTKKSLCLDHCHKTGKLRGWLCHECNVGLGRFKDDIALLQRAIDYIKKS